MLDPWIIEEIIRREEEKQREEAPRMELPLERPQPQYERDNSKPGEESSERGVTVIDL